MLLFILYEHNKVVPIPQGKMKEMQKRFVQNVAIRGGQYY